MDFGVLGPLKVSRGGHELAIGSTQQRRLLAALLVHAGTVLSTDRLVAVLWGDEPPASSLKSLHAYISRLRGLLHGNDAAVLLTRPPGYILQIGPEQTDAGRFQRLLGAARAVTADDPEIALARLDEGLALWRGPAYAEFADEEFARSEAVRLNELRLAAVEERFDAGLALRRHADLVGSIEAFAAEHPLRERPRAQLMLALYRCGRQAEALSVFRTFRDRLGDELGVEPSATLRALETAVLRQSAELEWTPRASGAALRDEAPPPKTQTRIPAETSSFVGREQDVADVIAALGDSRVVTLTGVGGVGKTRLARQVAAVAASRYPHGVWWCELAPVADGSAVGHALAAAVGARQQPRGTIEHSVIAFLAARHALLVIDNCEHVVDEVARLVEAIVRDCPKVTVLATSRTRLGVMGERIRPTAPLPLPEPGSGADAGGAPAVQLFVDRARAVRPDLDLSDENLADIADVCYRLDGLPLSIELAAARMRSLNPADLAARVDDRFGLLATGTRTAVERHRTLRAAVDWSYALLSPAEQRLFDRLSVFAGGFTLAAAEQVCGDPDVLDLLAALVDSSLLATDPPTREVRYRMLATLQAYGRERLERRGETDMLRRAHARYYTSLAEQGSRGLRGEDEGRWVTLIEADLDNLRAAHRWAMERADSDVALTLSAGLRHYTLLRFNDEVVSWGEAALDLPGAGSHPLYPQVCGAVGEGLTLRGDLPRALALARRGLAAAGDPGDHRRIPVLKVIAAVALYEGRLDDCLAAAGECLRLAQRHDDLGFVAEALLFQGLARTYAGDAAGGLVIANENLRVAEALGNPSMTAWALYNQAEALSRAEPEQARRCYERAVALAESVSSTFTTTIAQVGLAALLSRTGAPGDALRAFRDGVNGSHRMQVRHHQWTTLRNLVQLLVRIRAFEQAAVLLGAIGAANTASAAYGADAESMAEAADLLRKELGPPAFEAATARGACLDADATVAFALSTIDRALTAWRNGA